ncbi:MAG TPA: response regulator [Candidatus Aquilonibacter sp.]|nr:response regulator [Candidatus Aquilonibacter sp.]
MPTILIVDDEAANRELLRVVLTHAGYDVIAASNGSDGFDMLVEQRPHLVIVDLYMPEMSGTEFIKSVRKHAQVCETRIALYTGSQADRAMHDFMEMMRVRHIIPKPAEPQEIMLAVEEALR